MSIKTLLCQLVCIGCLLILPAICLAQQNDVSALLKQAAELQNNKQYDEAQAIYQKIITTNPGSEDAFRAQTKLTVLYILWDRQAEADNAVQELVTNFHQQEDLPTVLVSEIGSLFREADKYESARKVYQYVVTTWPADEQALYSQSGVVKCCLMLKDDVNADAALEQLLSRFGEHQNIRPVVYDLAVEYRSMRKWAKARQLFRYFLERWPDDERAMKTQRLVIKAGIRLGDDPNAEAATEKLIEQFGDRPGIKYELKELANDWTESGKYDKAVPLYEYVIQRYPEDEDSSWVQMAVAVTSAAAGDQAAVTAALNKLGTQFAGDADIAKLKGPFEGFCRHILEICDEEPEVVRKVITDKMLVDFADGGAASAIDHIGDFYRDTRQYDKAAEAFQCVADNWQADDRAIESQANIVKMYISIGDEPNSTAYFDRLISKFGQDKEIAAAVENVAQEYLEFGSTHKAYEKFQYILEHWPGGNRAVWAKAGMVMSRIKAMDFEAAESELFEFLRSYPKNKDLPAAVHEIVEEYRNCGAYEAGRELFGWILENWQQADMTMLELQVGIALQSIRLGELDKADAAVDRLIADYNDNPNFAKGLFQIAEQHFYAENYRKMIKLLELIQTDYPDSDFPNKKEIPYMLGTCYYRVKNYHVAIEYYIEALEETPNCEYAYRLCYELGFACRRQGDYEQAVYWFNQQRQVSQDKLYGQRALFDEGLVYLFKLKDYETAAEVFESYPQLYPQGEDIDIIPYNLALCYEKLGDKNKAVRLLKDGLKKYPDMDYVDSYQQKLAELQSELK